MTRLIFLFFLFLISNYVVSQTYLYQGYVIDTLDETPVANVHVICMPDNTGTITNKKGYFKIISKKSKINLHFSHISYKSKPVIVNYNKIKDSTLVIAIMPKTYMLKEIDINNKTYETVYYRYDWSILDYAIYQHRIFFIVKDYNDFTIKLFSMDTALTDTTQIIPPATPKRFYIDIYGNLNFISDGDSAYQIKTIKNTIVFFTPISFDLLKEQDKMYQFKIDNKYFYSDFESSLMDKLDFGFVSENGEQKVFYSVYDEDKINYYYLEMRFLGIVGATPPDKRRKVVEKYYFDPALYFDRKFMYNNIQNIFFCINNVIYIIDNVHNKLIRFDKNGNKTGEVLLKWEEKDKESVNTVLNRKGGHIWKKTIIIDEEDSNRIYLPVKKGVKTELFSLNLFSGRLQYIKTFPHIFPKKPLIYKHKLYYLYEKTGTLHNWGLFRTKLEK